MANLGEHAIVIGGSVAGLMTAKVLADFFDRVTVLERDHLVDQPETRKSIPQGNHYHALLLGGQQVLSSLYPGFIDRLNQLGAVPYRVGKDVVWYRPDGKSYLASAMLREPYDLGWKSHGQSRGLLERCIRQSTHAVNNINVESGVNVQTIHHDNGGIQAVSYHDATGKNSLAADLVVDAGGRHSNAPRRLVEMGFEAPEETTIGVDLAYSSAKLRIPSHYNEPERLHIFFAPAPYAPNGAVMGEIEAGVWHLSLAGRFGNYPPQDVNGFLACNYSGPKIVAKLGPSCL